MKVTITYSEDEAMLATALDQTVARLLPKAKHSEEKTDDGGFLRRITFLTKPPSRKGRKAIFKTKAAITQNRKADNGKRINPPDRHRNKNAGKRTK